MASGKTITKIEAQKKRKNRVSIYLDEAFAFGVDISVVAKFHLKKGNCLDEDDISEILLAEEKKQIKESALRYLAGRAHSEQELRTKLRQKGYSETHVAAVLDELKEARFIDDGEFAHSFVRNRMVNKPMGERGLRHELLRKGVSEEIIDRAVKQAFAEHSQEEIAMRLVERRKERYNGLPEPVQTKRLHDFLMRRGFSWEVVNEVMEKIPRSGAATK
ncbi:MAG: RecX family transcriptional regulator [bacterium]